MLTACNQTQPTAIRMRWDEETHVFNITLADFESDDSDSFKVYKGTAADGGDSYKDIAFTGEFYNWDEIRPVSVHGTYSISIKPSKDGSDHCDVATVQEMCVEYNVSDIAADSQVLNAKATAEQLQKFNITHDNDSTVVLYSSTETFVSFENTLSQKPLSSSIKVNGFYVGKKAQELSKYEVSTVYDYTDKKPVAKITKNGETTEYKFSKNSAGTFIDSNQILMYLRSLDKSSKSFQDRPSKSVFNPYGETLQTANFGMSYSYNMILTNGQTEISANLTVVSVTVGNNAFLMQENLPDSLAKKNLDTYSTLNDNGSKYTTVRFRAGYLAYEIDYSNSDNTADWDAILTALTPSDTAQ